MTDTSCRSSNAARSTPTKLTTASELIDWLGRRGARGDVVLLADGTRCLGLSSLTLAGHAVATYVAFTLARDGGWLEDAEGTGLRWVLSYAGRAQLRRQRSQTEAAAPAPAAMVVPAHVSSRASVNPAESPLAWLRRRKDKAGEPLISAMEFDAGERLRADFTYAAMGPRVTVNWSAIGGGSGGSASGLGVDIRDSVSDAQQRVRRALAAVGPISSGVLIDVCGHLKGLEDVERTRGWPPRSGKVGLQIALFELARHYGLPGSDKAPNSLHIRHWGAGDYKPSVSA
jgi:hypothetical protein